MPEGAATRLGWGQEYANLQAPLGYDKFGYSWRSRKGTKFHESHGKSYSPGYGEGDTLGCLIILPQTLQNIDYMPHTFKDRVSCNFVCLTLFFFLKISINHVCIFSRWSNLKVIFTMKTKIKFLKH